jgi:4-amino-4-deoxy-L-arabinose transferase-like glycosyltransferase
MDSSFRSTRLQRAKSFIDHLAFYKLLLILFFFSLILHGSIVSLFINQPIALDDMFQYDMLARSIKGGNGFRWYSQADVEILRPYYSQFLDIDALPFPKLGIPTTFRAPGYPFFLALLYLLVPNSFRFGIARLAQAGIAAALAPLVAILGRQLGLTQRGTLLAGIGTSIYPILLAYPIGLASENLYIALGLCTVIVLFTSVRKPSRGWLILAGLLCGVTLLTRSIFALFALLAGIWLACNHLRHWRAGLLFLLVAFGVCLPWSIRNSLLMKKPAFVENSLGYNLFIGYHPQGDGGFVSKIAILPMNILDDAKRDRYCMQQALEFIRAAPVESLKRVFVRLVKFISPEDREFVYFYSNDLLGALPLAGLILIYLLLVIPWGSILIFGTVGLGQTKNPSLRSLIVLFLVGYCLPHLFIIAEPRFHLAWVPMLVPLAGLAWESRKTLQWNWFLEKKNIGWTILFLLAASLYGYSLVANFPTIVSIMHAGGNVLHYSY